MNDEQRSRIYGEVLSLLDEMSCYWNTKEGEGFYEDMESFAQELINKLRFLKEHDD